MYSSLVNFSNRIKKFKSSVTGEQHTKNVCIEPLLRILGYDITNPYDIVTEFSVEFGTNRGEKVDYALFKDGEVIILIEAKDMNVSLETKQTVQLSKYFNGSNATIGVLTNGIEYKFYTDLIKPSKMDFEPFYTFNIENFVKEDVEILSNFSKENFDKLNAYMLSKGLVFKKVVRDYIIQQSVNPSKEFVDLLSTKAPVSGLNNVKKANIVQEEVKNLIGNTGNKHIDMIGSFKEAVSTRVKEALTLDTEGSKSVNEVMSLEELKKMSVVGTKPTELIFIDKTYIVKTWADVLLCGIDYCFFVGKPHEFVLRLGGIGNGKGWVRRDTKNMISPRELNHRGVFVDTNASASLHLKRLLSICKSLEIMDSDVLIRLK